ncbi:soluble lytic murein transglycosylase [Peptoclostridium litorale DSM 5388]|uniref:Transglycosylase SLT domain-containing protein n=2 Tax=Peptoclostridium litorale TaxID=1557 RepID=A0A069RDC5_PEPLI|nr:lytic transglycosylase domain-containing protein [Peptoclostridium litorale]KDR95041.1 transglycosylase SLT domain-containing protein [Peptoclostridium litorale DSM 5388]SIN76010.1 soluble lytic murein transglycosylase [Peptoclostridium litorale DSM 5388]
MRLKKNKFLFRAGILISIIAMLFNVKNTLKLIYPMHYSESVYRYSNEYEVDPMLIFSIMKTESKFFPYAKSRRDAKGLMQLMDITYEYAGGDTTSSKASIYDPDTNIKVGCWYVKKLSDEFEYDNDLVVAAYNAGPANVKKWLSDERYSKDGEELEDIPYGETKNYVNKVLKTYERYNKIYRD